MDPLTLGLVAFQVAVSLYNQRQNVKLTTSIKEEQHKAKVDEIKNNQRRDMERFMRSCQLQEKLEEEAHLNKLEKYKQDFLNSLIKMAHKENLDNHYHLNVSPYVIQRSLIPLTTEDLKNTRQELFCILTGSNNLDFNKQVLPYLDDMLCELISKYWNESSNHTICYYQNMWDSENEFSNEDIDNIKSLINTPTISISPILQKVYEGFKLYLKVGAWGMGQQESLTCEIDTEIKFKSLPNKYSLQLISEITNEIVPKLVCAVGYLADVFYWINYYQAPLLPVVLGKGKINVSKELSDEYSNVYSEFYKNLVIGDDKTREISESVYDFVEINQYNYPERSLSCLKNIIALTGQSTLSSELINQSMLSFFRVRTDKSVETLMQLDSSLLQPQDIDYPMILKEYAESIGDSKLTTELTEIIRRYIISWRYSIS